ncbi:MAG TPA: hypothetical protein VMZ91_02030 [Candidatus Paceibacterota bacterium]|nr:hypothetical protein [Candidatus Paceibacterota bacterium]
MKLRPTVSLLIVVMCMAFCVHCYKLRNTYNTDEARKCINHQNYEIEVLSFALSIIPEEIKGTVYVTSIMRKYSDIMDHTELAKIIGIKIEIEEEGEEKTEDKDGSNIVSKFSKPAQYMNRIMDSGIN